MTPLEDALTQLRAAMTAEHVSQRELSRRMGTSLSGVQRLLSPDHDTHLHTLERAASAVGRKLKVLLLLDNATERKEETP